MQLFISRHISITDKTISIDGKKLITTEEKLTAELAYRELQVNYPKFFKMDLLSKWTMIGCECLTNNGIYTTGRQPKGYIYDEYEKEKIAIMLMTGNGCLDVDKRYLHSTETIASPALFVYTLPNIMLGEICIKHGFKGEQLCMVDVAPNDTEIDFWVKDILKNRHMDACLCGWVDALDDTQIIHLLWIDKKKGYGFSTENLKAIFSSTTTKNN